MRGKAKLQEIEDISLGITPAHAGKRKVSRGGIRL